MPEAMATNLGDRGGGKSQLFLTDQKAFGPRILERISRGGLT